jgi:hypothetical protein
VNDKVRVGAWVSIASGSRLRCALNGERDFEFCCGEEIGGFEFVIEREALERFVALGAQALARPTPAPREAHPALISHPTPQ